MQTPALAGGQFDNADRRPVQVGAPGLERLAHAQDALLPVLDDLDRAEQHGDLEEGTAFATIAQKIRGVLERMGVEAFGEKGEPFDPPLTLRFVS